MDIIGSIFLIIGYLMAGRPKVNTAAMGWGFSALGNAVYIWYGVFYVKSWGIIILSFFMLAVCLYNAWNKTTIDL